MGTPKSIHQTGFSAALEATYEWRRKNVPIDKVPPEKRNAEFYGIWPFSNTTD